MGFPQNLFIVNPPDPSPPQTRLENVQFYTTVVKWLYTMLNDRINDGMSNRMSNRMSKRMGEWRSYYKYTFWGKTHDVINLLFFSSSHWTNRITINRFWRKTHDVCSFSNCQWTNRLTINKFFWRENPYVTSKTLCLFGGLIFVLGFILSSRPQNIYRFSKLSFWAASWKSRVEVWQHPKI